MQMLTDVARQIPCSFIMFRSLPTCKFALSTHVWTSSTASCKLVRMASHSWTLETARCSSTSNVLHAACTTLMAVWGSSDVKSLPCCATSSSIFVSSSSWAAALSSAANLSCLALMIVFCWLTLYCLATSCSLSLGWACGWSKPRDSQ